MDNTIKYDEGGQIQRHKSWNELSLSEKSEMIKVAVMNGITDLPTIKEKYNEFAEGGTVDTDQSYSSHRIRKFEDGGFTSELDWSPDSWFSKRVAKPDGTLYNDEEAARLASHVPEYNNIEQTAKANGTWLKMPDGSTWKGDPRSWVMMQSESYKKNYSPKPWYTGQAEWPTTFDYGEGKVDTNKVTRAPYYNNQMWFSDSEDYGQTFADYQNSTGLGWRFDTPGEENIKGHNFLSAIPKEGNYRTLESSANGRPDQWQRLPFVLEDGTINRLPENQISVDSKGRNIRADKQKVLTDDVVNWSKDLGDQGIFMQNIDDGAIIKNGEILRQPVNEFISQPGFTDKVKFIEGNTGDFDIDNPYKYANNFYIKDNFLDNNYAALGGPLVEAAMNEYRSGGNIHIKPENKGKFTRLKERTGHSATWFKEHGTPAKRKMATFDLNSRHWHNHAYGGNIFALGGGLDEEYKYATTYLPEITVTPTRAQKEQAWRKKEGNIAKSLISHPTLPNLLSAAEHYVNSIPGLRTAPSEITGIIASEPLLPDVKNAAQIMKVGKVVRAFEDAVKGVKSVPQITTTKIGVNRDMPDFMKLMQKVDKSLPILSKEKSAEISKYANSQKNAVTQLRERMSDPKYAQMIRSNSNPEFMVEGNPVYIEGYDSEDRKNIYNFLTDKIMGMTDDPFQQVNYYAQASNAVQNNSAFALPHTKYAFIPKKNTLLDREFVKMASDNAGKQYQYSIIKAHEGSHVLSHPNKESPLHQYLSGFDGDYFGYQRDAELSARGTQLKNYFDKKELSADDLKYASQHYVEDTGIDNKMTSMFNQIKTAAKKEPDIWKKLAKWMSSTSPVWMSGIINTQHKD